MSVMKTENLSFSYPGGEKVLHAIDFCVDSGEFVLVCGPSGCGKTTLLRCMKKEIAPTGAQEGTVTWLPPEEVGFVFQNPDNQIVTDTVRHEMAFGLENMGLPTETIRRRVAETALFFGLEEWLDASVREISGGQKQLLNLAAVIAMRPRLLLLDEPVSQLDPSARKNFLDLLTRVNRELGIAVVISEHHLEELLPLCDRIVYMKEGRFLYEGDRQGFVSYVLEKEPEYEETLPAAARIAHVVGDIKKMHQDAYPLTVREGRRYIEEVMDDGQESAGEAVKAASDRFLPAGCSPEDREECLHVDHIWFQYNKKSPYVLKGLELSVRWGECHMILGGNGSGKTTLLSVLGKRIFADRGKIRLGKRRKMPTIGYLTQNPKAMFSRDTVEEELEAADVPETLAEELKLTPLKGQHPYDISGGEQQRLGLALVLSKEPDLLLLDEPSKGQDIVRKKELGRYLRQYAASGHSVLCVTHDVEFAARYGDVCSLLSEGEILSTEPAGPFFKDNAFYTTDSVRILRGWNI